MRQAGTPIRVLILEDSPEDLLLIVRELRRGGYEPEYERVETVEGFERALDGDGDWDLVISDYYMPRMRAPEALELARKRNFDAPFIVVSGSIGEEIAVETMKAGANDYVMKDRLTRLPSAVRRELREAALRRRYARAEEALRRGEERFRATFEQAAVGVSHVGLDGRGLMFNQKLCDIVGRGREELMAMTFKDITHPEDLDEDLDNMRALVAGEIPDYSMEKRCVRKDGTLVWVRLTVSAARDAGGAAEYLITVTEDITVRTPAWADVTPASRSIEVFHGIEFVGLGGYPANSDVRGDVLRGPDQVRVGTVTAQTNGQGALEINHLGGGQFPSGDCWAPPVTPDIQPGDKVQTTVLNDPTDVDFTIVRDIFIDTDATTVDTAADTITMKGNVRSTLDAPIDINADILELRLNASGFTWDANGGRVDLRAQVEAADFNDGDADATTFTHVFQVSNADADNAASGAFEQAFEWSAGVAGNELTVFDGVEETPGCPPMAKYAITESNPTKINAANVGADLVLSGVSNDATEVSVTLEDSNNTPTTDPLTRTATPTETANGTQTWSITFPGGAGSLNDGTLVASGSYTVPTEAGGTSTLPFAANLNIVKDVQAPAAPTATPDPSRLYNTAQSVRLTAEPGAQIRFTMGDNPATPTATSELYNGPITVSSSQTIKAIAIDGAGNASNEVSTFAYTIDTLAPAAPDVNLDAASDSGSSNSDNRTNDTTPTFSGNTEAGASVRLLVNGANKGSAVADAQGNYSITANAPLPNGVKQVVAEATDEAGNSSRSTALSVNIDLVGPTVAVKKPSANALGVKVGSNVTARFSEPVTGVNRSTFTLKQGAKVIPSVVTYNAATRTATLNPRANLASGKRYIAMLTSGVKDSAGNSFRQSSWRFTTR